jgi:hypothetical protein
MDKGQVSNYLGNGGVLPATTSISTTHPLAGRREHIDAHFLGLIVATPGNVVTSC